VGGFLGNALLLRGGKASEILSLAKTFWWVPTILGALFLLGMGVRFFIRRRNEQKT
jgi:hypothetical protein